MQCKDIPEIPILQFLADRPGVWCNWYFGNNNDVTNAMPAGTPGKVKIAKMRRLIERGLVDGCPCGCRGDFQLTPKGCDYLTQNGGTPPSPSTTITIATRPTSSWEFVNPEG